MAIILSQILTKEEAKGSTFFTSHIEQYIKRYGIMPFDIFNFSHHSSVYVDINILTFLKDYFINPQTLYWQLLVSTNPHVTTLWKKTKHNFISPFKDIQNIIDDTIITKSNINHVKLVDNIMTQCMLKLKQTLKYSIYSYLWSPNIAFVLLEIILWTLFSTTLNKKCNNTNRISKFIDHMKTLPYFKLFTPIEHSNNSIVKTNLKSSLITLIPINTRCYEN